MEGSQPPTVGGGKRKHPGEAAEEGEGAAGPSSKVTRVERSGEGTKGVV